MQESDCILLYKFEFSTLAAFSELLFVTNCFSEIVSEEINAIFLFLYCDYRFMYVVQYFVENKMW